MCAVRLRRSTGDSLTEFIDEIHDDEFEEFGEFDADQSSCTASVQEEMRHTPSLTKLMCVDCFAFTPFCVFRVLFVCFFWP